MEKIESNGCPYDLIISHLITPKLNGKELAKKIKQRFPIVKNLFISVYG